MKEEGGKEFVEAEGLVHLVSPEQCERTLCGDAFDLASDIPGYEWKPARRRIVTCPHCVSVILECRNVRIAQKDTPPNV